MKRTSWLFFLVFLVLIISISPISAVKTITVSETEFVSLKPQARDDDNDQLTYNFSEPLDGNGRWQTNYGDAGEYLIILTVSDGELSTSEEVLLIVEKKNVGPGIDSYIPEDSEINIDEGEAIEFKVEASDLNKDPLGYTWKLDSKLVSETSSYIYEPDYGDSGRHSVEAEVSDGEVRNEKIWGINVNKIDREALLDGFTDIEVSEGEKVILSLPNFEKYDLDYTISEPVGNDGVWETGYDDSGVYAIEIRISDRDFKSAKTIEARVLDKDRPPVLKPIANAWMKENQKVSIELEASDPDGDEVVFSVEGMPGGASLNGNKFEWAADYDIIKKEGILEKTLDKFHLLYKPFRITFIAKSGGFEAKESAWVILKDVNKAPILKEIPEIKVKEGEEVIIKPEADDPDGDSIRYSYSGWIGTNRYITGYITGYDDAGTYRVRVAASDGFLEDEKYATIIVEDVNRAPTFGEIKKIAVKEGELVEISLAASDDDGDSVNISAESLPRNASIENDIFSWSPDYDTVSGESGIVTVNFKASDGNSETIKQANITVYNVNKAPEILGVKPDKEISIYAGNKVVFEVEAKDIDGDELDYWWKFSFLEQYKGGNAMGRTFTSAGDKTVKAVVSDGKEETEYEWRVKVLGIVKKSVQNPKKARGEKS